jgi:hypothetical protein
MLAIRDGLDDGALHLPEYDITLGIPDGSVTLFDGQGTWHGVTPIVRRKKEGYRYTIVLYTKQGMVGAGNRLEEGEKAKRRATKADVSINEADAEIELEAEEIKAGNDYESAKGDEGERPRSRLRRH